MIAFKFLASGAIAPITGFVWPSPKDGASEWVDAVGPLKACERGIHVSRIEDLAYWIHDELWAVEVAGEWEPAVDAIVCRRARLVRAIDSWTTTRDRFATSCAERAAAMLESAAPERRAGAEPFASDAATYAKAGYTAVAALCAAIAAGRVAAPGATIAAYRAERSWQSAWLERELELRAIRAQG
jgi:hypothetical protein